MARQKGSILDDRRYYRFGFMATLATIIKQAIEKIDTRKLIFKTPFEDRFTNALVEKLNCISPYFCIEQYPIKLGENTRDSKIDLVGFAKKSNHANFSNFETNYYKCNNKDFEWCLETKFYSPHQNNKNYFNCSFDGPKDDFEKLRKDFNHFVVLMLQVEVENLNGLNIDDFEILRNSYNFIKTYFPNNFEKAQNHLKKDLSKNRVESLFDEVKVEFGKLVNEFTYSSEQGFITKKLIDKGGNCPLKIHFMINEFEKKPEGLKLE